MALLVAALSGGPPTAGALMLLCDQNPGFGAEFALRPGREAKSFSETGCEQCVALRGVRSPREKPSQFLGERASSWGLAPLPRDERGGFPQERHRLR